MTRRNAAGEGDRPPDGPPPGAKTPDLPAPAPGETGGRGEGRRPGRERDDAAERAGAGTGQEPADGSGA
ncbi:hypothetical protein ACFVXK_38755, partial [Streptomyces sp. NPDC058157]